MTWNDELDELRLNLPREAMGGEEKVARQHEFGKLTIRERIDEIADDHSFHEIGKLAGVGQYNNQGELEQVTPSNFVFGSAKLDGRSVFLPAMTSP